MVSSDYSFELNDDYELFNYVDSSRREEETFHFLGFEYLHRMNIVQIQNDLIAAKEDIFRSRGSGIDKRKLRTLLAEYVTAIQNYNYVHQARRLDPYTTECRKQHLKRNFASMTTSFRHTRPFESRYFYLDDHSERYRPDFLRDKLRRWLPSRLSYSPQERHYRSKEFEEGKIPNEISAFVDNVARFCVAFIAGLALIGPMCIMRIQPSLVKSLVTASVFIVLFICGLSFGFKSTNMETLVATATYSAVIVVFVGINSS